MSEAMYKLDKNIVKNIRMFSFKDDNQVYTNGVELVPVGRVVEVLDVMKLQELVIRDEPKPVNHLHPLKAFGKCPVCNETVHLRHHRQFCGECGSKLIWGETKND